MKKLHLPALLDRIQPSESMVLGGIAMLVGLTSGIAIWLFKQLIDLTYWFSFETVGPTLIKFGAGWLIFIPVLGGLVVGLLRHFLIGQERHHGVAGIMEAVALAGGRLRYNRIPAKTVAAAISIGSGASVGPEDPSVQIGANLGSMLGQIFHLSDERMRTLVGAGAAGGIAAAFNAPIAGVFFALEIILGELNVGAFGVVVLAAVISSVFTQAVSGNEPAFHIPAYAFHSAWELPLYLGLGLVAGLVAAGYIRLIYGFQDFFHHRVSLPTWLHPALAGLGVGLVGLILPQIFGIGYETIEGILNGENYALGLLFVLLLAKIVLTPLSIGGGFQGGVFAPALFLGATLGGGVGLIAAQLFPSLLIDPPAFAMVGMAAVLAGTVHAPLTAILLLFEMTHDYRIILPLMFAVGISLAVSERLQRDSVYALGLARKGIRLEHGRDVEVLEGLTVGEVMQTEFKTLPQTATLTQASELLLQSRHHGLPVVNLAEELIGVLTVQDLERAQSHLPDILPTVGEVCTRNLLTAFPDETIGTALRRMGVRDIGRLPVVSRDNPRQILGVLRRTDLVRAYSVALTRRAMFRHRVHQARLDTLTDSQVHVDEITIEPGAVCAGKRVSEIPWPRDAMLATLRRGRQVFIPHGDTVLQAKDVLVVVTENDAREKVVQFCVPEKG